MKLYYNPVSSYSQKTLMAFYEKEAQFTPEIVDFGNDESIGAYKKLYPLGKVPLLVFDDGYMIPESSIIIEWLDTHVATGTKLIPDDIDGARRARFFDRQSDLYLNDTMTTIFFDGRKPEAARNPARVAAAKAQLDIMYGYINEHFAKNTWCLGDTFSMADCAASAPLSYLRFVYPYAQFPNITAYFNRIAARPSFQRVMTEAGPWLKKFGM